MAYAPKAYVSGANLNETKGVIGVSLYDSDVSIVYCLLVNRAQFLHEQSHLNNRHNVNFSRATLCELVATRILRRYSEDNDGPEGLLLLANILVAGFEPFQNAPDEIREEASAATDWTLSC